MHYSPSLLREQWDKKYSTASKAFLILTGLQVLVIGGLAYFAPVMYGNAPGMRERLLGVCLIMAGMMLSLGTGLIKKWRWAAIVASLWCLFMLGTAVVQSVGPADNVPTGQERSTAFESGRGLGGGCGGIILLIALIAVVRAAIAKRAPPEEEVLDIDPDLRADLMASNPYGISAAVPEPHKTSTIALTLIGAGVFAIAGGTALFAKGLIAPSVDYGIADSSWRIVRGDGFQVEFPGEPEVKRGFITNVDYSHGIQYAHHPFLLEVVHYRIPEGNYLLPDALSSELDDLVQRFGSRKLYGTPVVVPHAAQALRYETKADEGGAIGVFMAMNREQDVYILVALAAEEHGRAICERFIHSFQLDP